MSWVPLVVVALFVGPLWATGELGWYSFDEPRSHLVWDEGMGAQPTPLDEPGGIPMLAAQLAIGLVGVVALAWVARSR